MYLPSSVKARFDANESAFLEKQLTFLESEIYGKDYPNLKARSIFPVANIGSGFQSIEFRQMDKAGQAKVIGSKANDLPRVDVAVTSDVKKVRHLGAAYAYGIFELREAARAGLSLDNERAMTARESLERKLDDIAFRGDSTYNLPGLMSSDNVANYTRVTPGKLMANATPDEFVEFIGELINKPMTSSKGIYMADTVLMDLDNYSFAVRTRLTDTNVTLLEYLRRVYPEVTFDVSYQLTNGVGGVKSIFAMKRDPSVMKLHIPSEFEQLAPQEKGVEIEINCIMDVAGLFVYRPKAVAYIKDDGT